MAKSKKKAAKKLIDLKSEESEELNLDSIDFDLDLSEIEMEQAVGDENKTVRMPPPAPEGGEDHTLRLIQTSATELDEKKAKAETKVSYGLPSKQHTPVGFPDKVVGSVESTLKQSEHLRIAQNKLNALEEEIEKLWGGNLLRVMDEVQAVAKTMSKG